MPRQANRVGSRADGSAAESFQAPCSTSTARDRRDRKEEASPQRTQERREIWGSYSKDSCQRGFTSGSMRSKASCRIAREVAKQILTCPSEPGPNQRGRPGTRATRV